MRIHLKSLGCRLNEAELETWARSFQTQGHIISNSVASSDLVVVNTCAVTQEAARKSRKIIRRLHRYNPMAKLVVSGCYASLSPTSATDLDGVDLLIPNQDKDQLVEITARELDLRAMPTVATEPGAAALFARGRNRAFVKVQDGCRYRCTFCIVTVARGEEHSRRLADIIEEINRLTAHNIKEVVLTGVHVGGFGSDTGRDLVELIHAILSDTDLPRLRLGSVEPWDLPDHFFDLFCNPRLMPHLHLPLQSGSDSVLRRMARRCKTDHFEQLVQRARNEIADFNVTTDIIVGFPGESDQEWQQGLEFIYKLGFSHVHIFSYSPREGTKAARMPGQIPPAVKKQRSRELHLLANQMRQATMNKYLSRSLPILWEHSTAQDDRGSVKYSGYTPNFLKVETEVPCRVVLDNKIREAHLISVTPAAESLVAELIQCR
jgi:threonylcarbamoyladenosine tRNA methylthiotransferase MtaB